MATPVTQYFSPDPSLSTNPNFGNFTQYLITGTTYITDSKAQVVYEFNPANPGVLINTGASYSQFQAYLLANPVTSTLPNPNGPPGGGLLPVPSPNLPSFPSANTTSTFDVRLYDLMENILLELRCIRLANVSVATQGGIAIESDFDPTLTAGFTGGEPYFS